MTQTTLSEFDDPEGCYRRGFDQGAYDALKAVWPTLTQEQIEHLQAWKLEVANWRYRKPRKRMAQPPLVKALPGPTPRSDPNGLV